jgi:predicted amidohydrolase YtcJ
LSNQGLLTVRIAYNLFTQHPKKELEDFTSWIKMVKPGDGNEFYRMNGAGEMLVFSAADWENTLEPRPDLAYEMESELKNVVKTLVQSRWPFRMHATYDESITRFLNVFEEVNREVPFEGLKWFFDHAETISEHNIERIRNLGGGIAIQDRLAFQGEHFIERYGKRAAENAPPIKKILEKGVPLGAGTDATRVSTYNPWISLYWLITGKTVGGTPTRSKENCLDRVEALRLYTIGSAWFSGEQDKKGSIEPGKFADLAILSDDYFSIPEGQIKHIESDLTIVGGKVVYAKGEFKQLPEPLSINPDWSPVAVYGGYYNPLPSSLLKETKSEWAGQQTYAKTNSPASIQQRATSTAISNNKDMDKERSKHDSGKIPFHGLTSDSRVLLSCCDDYFSF